jgi:hypothetical protein
MAKSVKSGGTSRIKFIMFDAEIADDQIPTVTQAITNALRGPNPPPAPRRLPAATPLNGTNGNGAAAEAEEPDLFDQVEEGDDAVDVTPATPRVKKPRKAAPSRP